MFKQLSVLLFMLTVASAVQAQATYGDYRVLVDVTGNSFSHNTQVYFDDESWDPQNPPSYSWDPCCDANLIGVSVGHVRPFIFTEVVESPAPPSNHMLSLNALPLLFEETEVPLGFLPGTLAPYTFSFTDLYTIPPGVGVELEDLFQNVTQDLLTDSTYDTWGAPSDDEARFILRFFPSNVTRIEDKSEPDDLKVVSENGQVTLVGIHQHNKQISLVCYNMLGEEVQSKTVTGSGAITLSMQGMISGIYVLAITEEGKQTNRVKFFYE